MSNNTRKTKLLSFVALLIVVGSSCEKEVVTKEKQPLVNQKDTLVSPCCPPSDHDGLDTTSATVVYMDNTAIGSNACVSSSNGILVFANFNCFFTVYTSLDNKTKGALDNWESNLGHTSLFAYYETLEADSTYDVWESDSLRHPDKWLERILNEDQAYRVGDTTYTFDFDESEVALLDHTTQQIHTESIPSIYSYKKSNWCSEMNKGNEDARTYDHPFALKQEKHQYNGYCYGTGYYVSQVWFNVYHYRKTILGDWNRKADRITSFLDQWHEIRTEQFDLTSPTSYTQIADFTLSNRKWVAPQAKAMYRRIHNYVGGAGIPFAYPLVGLCVTNWGRHHVYTPGNWNNDLHHDDW